MTPRKKVVIPERIPTGCRSVEEYRYSPRRCIKVGDIVKVRPPNKSNRIRATVRRIFVYDSAAELPDKADVVEVEVITQVDKQFRTLTAERVEV